MLVNRVPPRESIAVLARELSASAVDGRLAAYLEQPVKLAALSITAPHQLFVLNPEDLPEGDPATPAAQYGGWRYLLEVNRRVVAIATTIVDDAGRHRFGGITTGPAVAAVVFAVHVADELLRAETEECAIAALDVQAVHTVLLYLYSYDGSMSAFLPIGLATSLHPAHLYSRAEIRVELRKMVEQVRTQEIEDGPVGG